MTGPGSGKSRSSSGSTGYNTLRAPGQRNVDLGVFKNIRFSERFMLQFRTEMANAFNTPYFGDPIGVSFLTTDSIIPDGARVGEIQSLRTPMRIIQLGLKLYF